MLDFLVARYGEFVLLKPRFGWDTALLWLAPAGVLLVGVVRLVAVAAAPAAQAAGDAADVEHAELTAAERDAWPKLLDDGGTRPGDRRKLLNIIDKYRFRQITKV